ncbi:MAG TPA: zf-HC2 domain-containing protein [Pseudonocardiaceae bacterium]|jgi:anti-sigma factor RsiW|nr:zf-HC2 domain-containing protein [Pseudonocardiaceae bacterium]
MSTHDQGQLAAYCLDALPSDEVEEVNEHVRTCPDCQRDLAELRELREILDQVPPEALLDGEAEDSELLFARIQRAAEGGGQPDKPVVRPRRGGWWKRGLLVAAAVVLLAGAFAGGMLTQRHAAPSAGQAQPGTYTVSATDPATGVGMSMDVTEKRGWVALSGHFTGVTPGTPCDIYVVSRAGKKVLSGGWVAPPNADTAVITVEGSAVIDPRDIAAIEVDTTQGTRMVVAKVD